MSASAESELILEGYADGGVSQTTPVIVRELLMTLPENELSKVSVGIESERSSGWMWLVYARNFYVWNFKEKVVNCYELTLPSSGLIHSADLCYVWPPDDDDVKKPLSCIASSPEGCIRYWPKVNQPSVYSDISLELSGQVGHCIKPLTWKQPNFSLILATTTCSLFLVTLPGGRLTGNKSIKYTPLKGPQNIISGITRRVSSLIFSSGPLSSQEGLISVAITARKGAPNVNFLQLLNAKCQLQCWQIELEGENKLLWGVDLWRTTMEKVAHEIWRLKPDNIQQHSKMRIWPLDFVRTSRHRYAILSAIFDPAMSQTVHYAVVFYKEREHCPAECVDIVRLPYMRTYQPHLEEIGGEQLNLLCPFSSDGFFIHSDAYLAVYSDDEKRVYSMSVAEKDHILGAGVHADQLLLFTLDNGLQLTKIRHAKLELPYVSDFANRRFQLHQQAKKDDELEEMSKSDDRKTRLKAAFTYFLKQKRIECESVLESLFGNRTDDLDALTIQLAIDIADDYPASDPRWMHEFNRHVEQQEGPSTRRQTRSRRTEGGSLLLIYQLDDKRKTMEYLLSFLRSTKLKERLGTYQPHGSKRVPTLAALCQLGEKLEACALFAQKAEVSQKSDPMAKVRQNAMKKIVEEREESTGETLAVRDVFYRKVSSFHELIPVLIDETLSAVDKRQRGQEKDQNYAQELIVRLAESLMVILSGAFTYRGIFKQLMHWQTPTDLQTWINSDTARDVMEKCYDRMAGLLSQLEDAPIADRLTKQCSELADFILAECSMAPNRRLFEADLRCRLIRPLIYAERFDHALALAEKYRDFGLLIEICDTLGDEQLLESYKTKFQQAGFLEFLYDYCVSKGKPGHIFRDENLLPDSDATDKVGRYLDTRKRTDLKWILHAKTDNFEQASVDLLEMAYAEKESLEKRKTLFSLAKLTALATQSPEQSTPFKCAEEGLLIIEHQKRVESVANGPPLSAEQLIEAYLMDPAADEWSFVRAIDLMSSVCAQKMPSEDYDSLRTHLWACAITKDQWRSILADKEDLLASASDTVFCRTLQLLMSLYKGEPQKVLEHLPSVDELMRSQELQELTEDPKLEFVLRAGEEKVRAWITGDGTDGDRDMMMD